MLQRSVTEMRKLSCSLPYVSISGAAVVISPHSSGSAYNQGMLGTRLLHSVSYAGFWGQAALGVEAFIHHAADLGFGGVMLMAKRPHVSPLDYDAAQRRALRGQLEQRGLKDLVVAGYTNLTADLEHAEIPHREFQVAYIVELAKLTRDLGGQRLRIFTGYEHAGAAYGAQWKLVVDTLREAAARAGDLGVTLGVQNFTTSPSAGSSLKTCSTASRSVAPCSTPGRPHCTALRIWQSPPAEWHPSPSTPPWLTINCAPAIATTRRW